MCTIFIHYSKLRLILFIEFLLDEFVPNLDGEGEKETKGEGRGEEEEVVVEVVVVVEGINMKVQLIVLYRRRWLRRARIFAQQFQVQLCVRGGRVQRGGVERALTIGAALRRRANELGQLHLHFINGARRVLVAKYRLIKRFNTF